MTVQHTAQGAGAPTAAPPSLNAHYLDTTSKTSYVAVGTASAADWKPTATKDDVQTVAGALAGKVDAVPGKALSTEDYSAEDKAKLAALEGSHYRGTYLSLAALQSAVPAGNPGDYADVDLGVGEEVTRYVWDANDGVFVDQKAAPTALTAAQAKSLYESNADTNAFTDAEKAKLAALEPGGGGGGGGAAIGDVLLTAGPQPAGYAAMGSSHPLGTYPALDAIFAGGTFSAAQFAFPFNMDVKGVAINGNTIIASSNIQSGTGKNVFRSADRGLTWSLIDAEAWYPGNAVACDENGEWIVACDSGYFMRSVDDGLTWTTARVTGLTQALRAACYLGEGNWVMAGAAGNVVVGANWGANWYLVDPAIPVPTISGLAVGPGGKLFASTSSGVYVSDDSGWAWTLTSLTTGQYGCIAIDGDVIVAGGSNQLARSGDGGLTWAITEWSSALDVSFQGMASNKAGDFLGIGFTNTAYQSFDNGLNWERVTIGNSQTAVVCLEAGTRDWIVVGNAGANYKVTTAPASLRLPAYPTPSKVGAYMKAE